MSRLRTELASAYLVTAARVGAWATVTALLHRLGSAHDFAHVSIVRSTLTLVSYVSLSLTPVLLKQLIHAHHAATARQPLDADSLASQPPPAQSPSPHAPGINYTLTYARPASLAETNFYSTATGLLLSVGVVLTLAAVVTLATSQSELALDRHFQAVVALMATGMLARILGDAAGTLLQSRGKLTIDNTIVASSELVWPVGLFAWEFLHFRPPGSDLAETCAVAFMLSGILSAMLRFVLAAALVADVAVQWRRLFHPPTIRVLAPAAALLLLGQFADFLYAPLNSLLLSSMMSPMTVAEYTPALQIDGALLLLTAAMGGVLLPRIARALASGNIRLARRLYLRATFASLALLTAAAVPIGVFCEPVLHAWLGPSYMPQAPAILQIVLIHTVIGGSAGIARAVILAAGRYKTYALTAVAFGLANALGAALVLSLTHWGVQGVVAVTVLTVTLRCALWMPWYTLRLLKTQSTTRPPFTPPSNPAPLVLPPPPPSAP